MSSDKLRAAAAIVGAVVTATGIGVALAAQTARLALRFFPDDPILRDDDAALDASGIKERQLSETYDFLLNTFGSP